MKKMKFYFQKTVAFILALFFLFSITSAVASHNCRNATIEPENRIVYCNISVSMGTIFIGEGAKKSLILFERFIVNADLNNLEEARSDAVKSLKMATLGQKLEPIDFEIMTAGKGIFDENYPSRYRWVLPLVNRIKEEPEGSASREIWSSITIDQP